MAMQHPNQRKTYVVFRGRKPGIYQNWLDCHAQVAGYPGNVHRSYNNHEEAVVAWNEYCSNLAGNHSSLIFNANLGQWVEDNDVLVPQSNANDHANVIQPNINPEEPHQQNGNPDRLLQGIAIRVGLTMC